MRNKGCGIRGRVIKMVRGRGSIYLVVGKDYVKEGFHCLPCLFIHVSLINP